MMHSPAANMMCCAMMCSRSGMIISYVLCVKTASGNKGKHSSADRNAPCCVRSLDSTMPTFRAEKTYISGGACIAVEKHAILPKRRVGGSDRRNKRRIQEGPMGLFSNNKKLCPICGSPTPRLLPTKVEDMPLLGKGYAAFYDSLPHSLFRTDSMSAVRSAGSSHGSWHSGCRFPAISRQHRANACLCHRFQSTNCRCPYRR